MTNEERESGWESLVRGKSNGWFACRSTVLRRLKSPFPWISFHPQLALHFLLLNSLSRGTRVFELGNFIDSWYAGCTASFGARNWRIVRFSFLFFFFEREKEEEVWKKA